MGKVWQLNFWILLIAQREYLAAALLISRVFFDKMNRFDAKYENQGLVQGDHAPSGGIRTLKWPQRSMTSIRTGVERED